MGNSEHKEEFERFECLIPERYSVPILTIYERIEEKQYAHDPKKQQVNILNRLHFKNGNAQKYER